MILYSKIPDKTNKYFVSDKEGGLNPFPARPKGSTLQFQNCTFFAAGTMAQNAGVWITPTNAENFCSVGGQLHHLIVSQVPICGALAVWRSGKIGDGSDGAGHVVQVIEVGSDHIVTAESGWNAKTAFWTERRAFRKNSYIPVAASKYTFVGYLWPLSPLKIGSTGECVREMQRLLANFGYLRKTEIDGDFGRITLGAVCAFQLENRGICGDVDGIAGTKTLSYLADKHIKGGGTK